MDVYVPPARKVNRKLRFVRKYRWGEIDVLNEQHCDFVPLVKAVLKHIQVSFSSDLFILDSLCVWTIFGYEHHLYIYFASTILLEI